MTEREQILKTAFRELNKKRYIIGDPAEATITYPDFDPCRAVQAVAIIEWPAIMHCRPITLTHIIYDGERI